mmetsp:Transcript_7916/g.20964  ORF Transcript_7916/g.20964 Transcript_7916/m.20964 type:complete len:104 (+) Transcript_7916:115-426(+)
MSPAQSAASHQSKPSSAAVKSKALGSSAQKLQTSQTTLQSQSSRLTSRRSLCASPEHGAVEQSSSQEQISSHLCLADRLDWRCFCVRTPKRSLLEPIPEHSEW